MKITDRLINLKEDEYGDFIYKLTPTIDRSKFLGVRMPVVKQIAKEYIKDDECNIFLHQLPHTFYDENMLHSCLINLVKDYDEVIKLLDIYLPYVDSWAACDTLKPKPFKKNLDKLYLKVLEWVGSTHTYTIRFGIDTLMNYYLDDGIFKEEYLNIACVDTNEYYVNMMAAWFYSTALVKQYDTTIKYLKKNTLSIWVHNKTIQKACESNRLDEAKKNYLKTLKR